MTQTSQLSVQRTTAMSLIHDQAAMGNIDQFASYMAAGDLMTPKQFKNKPADCFMVTMQAMQWGMNPLSVATQVYPVNGNLAYGSQLIIAIILQSGMVEARPHYQCVGDWDSKGRLIGDKFENEKGLGVKVGFKFKGDSNVTYGETIFLADQTIRNSPLWKTATYQQLCYLGAKHWSRLYMPGATMGLYSESEAQTDSQIQERDVTPTMDASHVDVDFNTAESMAEHKEVLKEIITSEEIKPESTSEATVEAQSLEKEIKNENTVIEGELVDSEITEEAALDVEGIPLNLEIHTGTKLKDGTWRLNKKGKELLAQTMKEEAEFLEAKQKQAEKKQPAKTSGFKKKPEPQPEPESLERYVIAIHKEAQSVIGEDPLLVQELNEKEREVLVNNEWFPIEDEDNTYLVFCDEDGNFNEDDIEDSPFPNK
ncbi:hypothetical protein CJF42_22685 [Pseudoalteromonas sp. NBT06-2]|uniref:recombinase RecT n=1 Tax=Pseudoalteromonas sp. NBT06-2 TaxID=2025950 RepID=UPI000BA605A6|nr:recombinase RecT [Pseudoalteromonas sp. NBT06-2]PAJ72162.1 hypothetical protein CJF42_22685 [Pseudoalteromonas sp. NBT06-2]